MRDHKMTKVKNNARRRRKLRVRKLRYSCQWKIHAAKFNGGKLGGVDEANSENGGSESSSAGESNTMIIELGVSSGSVEGEREGGEARVSVSDIVPYSEISVIGRRREMEDEVRVKLGLTTINKTKYDFFAVYDGHGGAQVAEVCRKRLHEIVAEEISARGEREEDVVEWERLMEKSFERMDEEVNDGDAAMKTVGTTVVAAVIGLKEVVVANCGDCRAVLGRDGVALALSNDHKPGRADELKRIESDGGRVINWNGYRVLGVLATSRSIGDEYLKPFVISKPEVTVTKRTDNDEFLILGSDGLWDVVSNETACNVVRRCFGGNIERISLKTANSSYVAEAAAVLAELAVARGSKDNISVIVIDLRKPTSSPP